MKLSHPTPSRTRFRRFAVALLAGLALLNGWFWWASAGPAGIEFRGPRRPLFPARVGVFDHGQPAERGVVYLYPVDDRDPTSWPAGFPRGVVRADGWCEFSTYDRDDGAPAGRYLALIRRRGGDSDRYFRPESSRWLLEVRPEAATQTLPRIDLCPLD